MGASNGDSKKEGEQNIQGWLLRIDRSLWSPKEVMNYFCNDAINLISRHYFLYMPPESVRNFLGFMFSGGIERYQWHGMYLVGINDIYFHDRFLIFESIQNTTNLLNEEYLGQSPRNLNDSQTSNIRDQRQGLIKLVKDIFDKEQDALIAEINTLSEYRNERLPVNEDMLQKQVCGIHLFRVYILELFSLIFIDRIGLVVKLQNTRSNLKKFYSRRSFFMSNNDTS